MPGSADLFALDVPCDRTAPAVVREALADVHDDAWSLHDGLLVASELVTNAVLHSGCEAEHRLEVSASLSGDHLLISVHDPGFSGGRAALRGAEGLEAGSLGLRIVERLSRRWGAEQRDGYRVWAELPVWR
jgi:anti-sigma regulatory factor (Ser/Thr protein kinase)